MVSLTLVSIGSGNCLLSDQYQTITWAIADVLSIWTLEINREIGIKIQNISLKN